MLLDDFTLLILELFLFSWECRRILGLLYWLLKDFEHLIPALLLLVIGWNLISHGDVILSLGLEHRLGGLHLL